MPTYVYHCKKCGCHFEKLMTIAEHDRHKKPQCPKCQSRAVAQVPGQFQVITNRKA